MCMRFSSIWNRPSHPREASVQTDSPIKPGEYFPFKGFMFQITEVTKEGFTAKISGVTKKLAHLVRKENT
jgi:hypothetical protein